MAGFGSFDSSKQPHDSGESSSPREDAPPQQAPLTSADLDYELARRALSDHDYQHAAHHIAVALAGDPGRTRWLSLLDELIASTQDDLLPVKDPSKPRSYAEEALRAYCSYKKGKINEAVVSLCMVANAKQDVNYLGAWLLSWLADDHSIAALKPENILLLGSVIMNRFPEYEGSSPARRSELAEYERVFQNYFRLNPEADPAISYARTTMLRKLGRHEEAIAVATELTSRNACFGHLARAMALRARDRYDEALDSFKLALAARPDETAIMLDIADTYLQQQRLNESLRWYESAMEAAPDSDWALASVYYCRARIAQSSEWVAALLKLARAGNKRAHELQRLLASPWYGYLPEPDDASAHGLRSIMEARERDEIEESPVKMSLSQLEAPSCLMALHMQLQAMNMSVSELSIAEVQQPDPRIATGDVTYILWRYEDKVAFPVPPPPGTKVTNLVAEMARTPFDYWRSWRQARLAADQLTVSDIQELLGVMVHPPALENGYNALQWIPRVQLAATQIIANIDNEWDNSLRKTVLFDLARGPMDWSIEAAIIALTQLCLVDQAPLDQVVKLYAELLDRIPRNAPCCYALALLYNWAMLPISVEDRKAIYELIEDLEREADEQESD